MSKQTMIQHRLQVLFLHEIKLGRNAIKAACNVIAVTGEVTSREEAACSRCEKFGWKKETRKIYRQFIANDRIQILQ